MNLVISHIARANVGDIRYDKLRYPPSAGRKVFYGSCISHVVEGAAQDENVVFLRDTPDELRKKTASSGAACPTNESRSYHCFYCVTGRFVYVEVVFGHMIYLSKNDRRGAHP